MLKSDRSKSLIVIFVLLSTLLLGPLAYLVGVILMWKLTKWPRWLKIILSIPIAILLILTIIGVIILFIAKPVHVVGQAMYPSYKDGEFLLTKVLYEKSPVQRGDVVIMNPATDQKIEFIKRVIAVPGDKLEIKDGQVFLNDAPLVEKYLSPGVKTKALPDATTVIREGQAIILPPDQYFVMGDNRGRSIDSRSFGTVPRRQIYNKVLFCYWYCK